MRVLDCPEEITLEQVKNIHHQHSDKWIARETLEALSRRANLTGQESFTRDEIRKIITQIVSLRRRYLGMRANRLAAMTIHQAKNREFHTVVVIWPRQVRDNPEEMARLLYNAVTRAIRHCTVLVEDSSHGSRLLRPPFA